MKEKIVLFIENHFLNGQKLDLSSQLFQDRIIDSMGIIELVAFLEKEFQVSIPFETLSVEDFSTVDHIVDFLNKKRAHS